MTTTTIDPVRNFEAFSKSLRDFHSWLGDAAPGATDLDFFCERKGHFLVIEAKPWTKGVTLLYGQHRALYQLSRQPNTRVYLAGEDDDAIHLACFNTSPAPVVRGNRVWWPPDRFIPTDQAGLRKLVRAWWSDSGDENG